MKEENCARIFLYKLIPKREKVPVEMFPEENNNWIALTVVVAGPKPPVVAVSVCPALTEL